MSAKSSMSHMQQVSVTKQGAAGASSRITTAVRARLAANFFRKLSTQALVPYMTIDLAARIGATRAGFIIFFILALGAVINLYGGRLCDRFDAVSILRRGELAHAASLLAMCVLCGNVVALIGLYLVKNIFFSLALPAGELVIMRRSSPDNRGRIYTLNNTLGNVAIPSGALMGAFLYGWGLRPLLAVATALAIGVCLIYCFYMEAGAAKVEVREPMRRDGGAVVALFRNRTALYLFFATVLLFVLEFSFGQYFAVKIASAGDWNFRNGLVIDGAGIFGLLRAELAVVSVLAAWLCLRWVERLQRPPQLGGTVVLATASFIALLYVRGPGAMMLCVAVMGIVDAVANPALQARFMNALSSRHLGMHISIYSLSGRFANMIAAVVLAASGIVSATGVSMILCLTGIAASALALAGARHASSAP